MQAVDILVMAVHNRGIELRDGVDAEVGALVGDTLGVDKDIEEHESRVDRTLPVAQTADVVGAERCHHIVHDLLHRLDAAGLADSVDKYLIKLSRRSIGCSSSAGHCRAPAGRGWRA